MDDKDVGESESLGAENGSEELSVDGWADSASDWLRRRWRIAAVMLLVACLACALGIAGSYAWMRAQQRHQPRIDATLYETLDTFWSSGGLRISIAVQIRNDGSEPVTVDRADLSRSGFKVLSGGPDGSPKLDRNQETELTYRLAPDCDIPEVLGPTKLRLLVHAPGRDKQWLTVTVPQPAHNASGGTLAAEHFQSCFQLGSLQLTTRHASSSGGVLTLRVRLTEQPFVSARVPQPVRLTELTSDQNPALIEVSFTASGSQHGKPTHLPATGTLRIKVPDRHCTASSWPAPLTATVVTSDDARGQTGVDYDPVAATQILDFTTKHCS